MPKNSSQPIYSFLTIAVDASGQWKEKGSKFLSFAYPVRTEEDIKARLQLLKKKYFDASHYCFAWVLGSDKSQYRAFDDGEPNHSAGDPILGQLRSRNLTNTLVVVVRYFGGTKLGVSGLISAYRAAAEDALNKSTVVEVEVTEKVVLEFSYEATPDVMKLMKDFELEIIDQRFEEDCRMGAALKRRHKEAFTTRGDLLIALGKIERISYSES